MEKVSGQADVDVWKYALGFVEMRVVRCAIELGIADVLEEHGRAMTLAELSCAVGCPETGLHRILRFLTHRGIFFRKEIQLYAQSPLSRLLTRDNMGSFVLLQAGPEVKGLTAKDLIGGKGSGAAPASTEGDMWMPEDNHSNLFRQFLACHAKVATLAVINKRPETFRGVSSLVDVGGHQGTAMGMLVKAFPSIKRGINFDLPPVVSGAPILDGVQHVGGDMFDKIPQADAVMLMWILHDWSDQLCVDILKKCKEAVPKDGGKVIIVDAVLDDEEEEEEEKGRDEYSGARLAMDMSIMYSTVNGKERTASEWAQIINAAGFTKHQINHIEAIESIIEAYP